MLPRFLIPFPARSLTIGCMAIALSASAAAAVTGEGEDPSTSDRRFTCELFEGDYTVVYHPLSQPEERYPWAVPSRLGGGWTPERRCNEIARRLESYRPDGLLELQLDRLNNYDIICVTTEDDPSCRIVLTVPPERDPEVTLSQVFDNIVLADRGEDIDPASAFAPGDRDILEDWTGIDLPRGDRPRPRAARGVRAIDLRPFLDRFDGGTGERLDGVVETEDRRLTPGNFR